MILVSGAAGNDEYASVFARWVDDWENAAKRAAAELTQIGPQSQETSALDRLEKAIAAYAHENPEPLWIVLLGHGTATAGDAKFNLQGHDVNVAKFEEWLKPIKRPVVVVCAFSTSGAWLKPLSAARRVIVTATRSGAESNFARFGGFLARAIADPEADLDQDGQTSLLEAYILANRKTADWYGQEGRLATEHALLDDNADGAGTPGDWFKGVRAVKKPREGKPDGARAHQIHLVRSKEEQALSAKAREERDALEQELSQLRDQKAATPEPEYLRKLEELMLKLARIYRDQSSN